MDKSKKPLDIYIHDVQLVISFQTDCESFLQKFTDRNCFRFRTFAELWRENKFSAIFQDQSFLVMLQPYLEDCFYVAKNFLSNTDPYIQVGVLYLLYSIYYKQPVRGWIRIRVTKNEWMKLQEICERFKHDEFPEVYYIFCKMCMDGAFTFSFLAQPYGLEPQYLKRLDKSKTEGSKIVEEESLLGKFSNLIEGDLIVDQLEQTDNEYQSLADKYKEKHPELFIFPSNVKDMLHNVQLKIYEDIASNERSVYSATDLDNKDGLKQ